MEGGERGREGGREGGMEGRKKGWEGGIEGGRMGGRVRGLGVLYGGQRGEGRRIEHDSMTASQHLTGDTCATLLVFK